MSDITDNQREAFSALLRFRIDHKRWPSMRDLSAAMGLSPNAAFYRLVPLIKRGFLGVEAVSPDSTRPFRPHCSYVVRHCLPGCEEVVLAFVEALRAEAAAIEATVGLPLSPSASEASS